ncbi:MAG TPA: diacylglycerol kinase family protein [Vicinamibacterales bacterium]|nr:diacylglycerol kinase family protein [Vicinamibacterales bacterium]
MRVALIVNPISGLGTTAATASAARIELAYRLAADSGVSVDVAATTRAGHGAEMAAEYVSRGYGRVIAWGGDGTINEVAGPLIGTGVTLGIVPAGSGDGLARGLGISLDPAKAFRVALSPGRPFDIGWLGDRHFLNIGGVGFDAAVAAAFGQRSRRGKGGYVVDGLRSIWSYESRHYCVECGDRRVDGPCFVVAFANCRQYGSGIVLAPEADPADGQLDMIMVSGGPAWQQLWRARRLGFRRMAPAGGVYRARVTSATVTGEHLEAHVDGQPFEARGTLAVRIQGGAIRVAGGDRGRLALRVET